MRKLIPIAIKRSNSAIWIETECGETICYTYYQADRPGSIVPRLSRNEAEALIVSVARFLRDRDNP